MKNEKGKAYVYVRNWDLLQYDKDILSKYDLEKLNYWYIGSTQETLAERRAKFKYQMINQVKSEGENSDCYVMNETSIFLNNLVRFYRDELKLSESDIDKLVFDYYEKLELDLNYIEELQVFEHELLESKVIEQYMTASSFDQRQKVLSTRDGYIKIEQNDNKILAKAKNNRPIEFSFTFDFDIIEKIIDVPTDLQKNHEYINKYIKKLQQNDIIRQ